MQISYHPAATGEAVKEIRYYDGQSPGLGRAFKDELNRAIQRIMLAALRFTPGSHGTRRCSLDRFPHRIVYRVERETIRVYAIAHPKRKPDYWTERLG